MTACFDVWADESSFFSCKNGVNSLSLQTEGNFAIAFNTAVIMTSIVSWADVNYVCQTVASAPLLTDQSGQAGEALASAIFYLLQGPANGPPSFQGMVGWPMDHARFVPYDPSWYPNVGAPSVLASVNKGTTGNPYCYVRSYATGLVAVNASLSGSTSLGCQFTIPTGSGTWKDQFGNTTDPASGGTYTAGSTYTLPAVSLTGGCARSGMTAPGLTCSAVVLVKH